MTRITEILEVHQNRIGIGIVLQVRQDVVRGNISFVADRSDQRKTDSEFAGMVHDRLAHRPRLGDKTDPPPFREHFSKRRVETDLRTGINDTKTIRADHAHAVILDDLQQLQFALLSLLADLRKPGGDHDQSPHTLFTTLPGNLGNIVLGDNDNRQIDRIGHVQHGRIRLD